MKSIVNYSIHVGRLSSPVSRNVFSCLRYGAENDNISNFSICNSFKHCQNAGDNELKDITSALVELICIMDILI